MFKDFVKKQEANGRAAFKKSLDFYLDFLDKFDHIKILSSLDDEIQALKREIDEATKIEVENI
jgi:hypothetical protein